MPTHRRGYLTPPITTVTVAALLLAGCPAARNAAAQRALPSGTATAVAAPAVSATAGPASSPPSDGSASTCSVFPGDNVWKADVSGLPVHSRSAAFVTTVGATRTVHPDFGSGLVDGSSFGIPVTTVPAGTPGVAVDFANRDESDPGPYLLPPNARIEAGSSSTGDRHVIAFDPTGCKAYELFNARPRGGAWSADSGAIFELRSNRMRPVGHTSADAAGLSILAGLVQYDEVAAGRIDHAVRMTVPRSQKAFIWPASHYASSNSDPNLPPMGLRFRLKAGVDISGMPPQARVIAEALKRHGAIVADNGSAWFLTGTEDSRWDNIQLRALKRLTGNDFEAVDESGLVVSATSYQARR